MPALTFSTTWGACRLAWSDAGVTGFSPPIESETARESTDDESPPAWVLDLSARIRAHLDGVYQDIGDVRYDFARVTPFQQDVYRAALRVPPGQVRTYGWLAQALGRDRGASRAIGGALGRNPWPLLVPCHRFVGADGRMTGFSAPGGIEAKRRLLALEGAELAL